MIKKSTKPTLKVVKSDRSGEFSMPSRQLGQHGRALWDGIMSEYNITDTGGIESLVQICGALDRAEALAAEIERDGLTI